MKTSSESRVHQVKNLDVIGYADYLPKEISVPQRRAPIFCFKEDNQVCLFPPFRLVGNLVIDGTIVPYDDFEDFIATDRVTALSKPLPAIPQGMIWIDENHQVHYGPQDRENRYLMEESFKKYASGLCALITGNLDEALKNARWAGAANQKSVSILALEAALLEMQGKSNHVKVIREQSRDLPDYFRFNAQVSELVELGVYCQKERSKPYF